MLTMPAAAVASSLNQQINFIVQSRNDCTIFSVIFYGVCFVTPVHSPVEKFNDIFSAGVTKSATIRLNSERLHHVSTPTFYSTWLIHSISLLASMNVTECELHKLWKLKIEFRLVSCFRPMRLSIFSTSLTDRFPYVPVM